MGITAANNTDLVTSTINLLNNRKVAQTQKLRDYPLTRLAFDAAKRVRAIGERTQIRLRASGLARFVDLFEITPFQILPLFGSFSMEFAHIQRKYAFDAREEDLNGMDSTQVIDIVQGRRDDAWEDLFNIYEAQVARAPIAEGDLHSMRGIPYWLPYLNNGVTDPVGGFNAVTIRFQDGTTTTFVGGSAGLDANVVQNERLKRWAATYSGTVDPALVATMRRAMLKTGFRMIPKLQPDDKVGPSGPKTLLMPDEQLLQFEALVEAGPDDNKGEAMKFKDRVTVGRMTPIGVPEFDSVSHSPIHCVDWSRLGGRKLGNRYNRESPPRTHPEDQNITLCQIDSSLNLHCDNPRHAGWSIHLPIAA